MLAQFSLICFFLLVLYPIRSLGFILAASSLRYSPKSVHLPRQQFVVRLQLQLCSRNQEISHDIDESPYLYNTDKDLKSSRKFNSRFHGIQHVIRSAVQTVVYLSIATTSVLLNAPPSEAYENLHISNNKQYVSSSMIQAEAQKPLVYKSGKSPIPNKDPNNKEGTKKDKSFLRSMSDCKSRCQAPSDGLAKVRLDSTIL